MIESSRPVLLISLADTAEEEELLGVFSSRGVSAVVGSLGAQESIEPEVLDTSCVDEELRCSGASFALIDGALWSRLGLDLRHPPRTYLIVVLLREGEEAERFYQGGAFDCVYRSGSAWKEDLAQYFKALAALKLRFSSSLGALERRYEDLVHALPDIVYELDAESRISFINNSVRLLGYEPSDLAGKHFSVLLQEEDAKAVDRDAVLGLFRGLKTGPALSPKLFNERRGIERRTQNLEIRLKPKIKTEADPGPAAAKPGQELIGSIISYGEVTAAGEWAHGEGSFLGSVGIIRDVTLRRKSEEMLRKLYQAVDQLSAGLLVADRDFTVEYVNPAFLRITGFAPQEVLERSLLGFFGLDSDSKREIADLIREGFDYRKELDLETKNGASAWVELHVSPVRGPHGEISHAIAICEDMSRRRAMEELLRAAKEEAERADRAKSDFLASMGHELKSPVASILAASKLLAMGGDRDKLSGSITSSAQGLLELLSDILDFARFEAGKVSIRSYSFPLFGFLSRICEPYREQARERGLGFSLSVGKDDLIHTDPDRLGRAISAIISNALAFTDTGSVRVEAGVERRTGNVPHLSILVEDSGIGIAPEDQGRIFAPFVQLASPFTKTGGAGIGLSLARTIIRALGGEIRLRSERGKGSTFTILVPVGDISSLYPKPGLSESRYRILVVDDNEVNLDFMRAMLENAGQAVDTASTGAEALRLLEQRSPDAALLDIQMPGMSGLELGAKIRAYGGDRYDPGLPLIALTAFDHDDVLRSGVDFDAVFAKPADMARLMGALGTAVLRRENEGVRAFQEHWRGRAGAGAAALAKASVALPAHFEALRLAADSGEREGLRREAQDISLRLLDLGLARLAGFVRRLGLAALNEEAPVIRSRARRVFEQWSAFLSEAAPEEKRHEDPDS